MNNREPGTQHCKWEYKVVSKSISSHAEEDFLIGMGVEGWELVAVIQRPHTYNYYFKRILY